MGGGRLIVQSREISWEVIFWGLCSRGNYSGVIVWRAKVRGVIALGGVSLGVIVQG